MHIEGFFSELNGEAMNVRQHPVDFVTERYKRLVDPVTGSS